MVLIDTNVIMRYLLNDIPEQADEAERCIKQGAFTLPEIVATDKAWNGNYFYDVGSINE